jgi:hypothetical protein
MHNLILFLHKMTVKQHTTALLPLDFQKADLYKRCLMRS